MTSVVSEDLHWLRGEVADELAMHSSSVTRLDDRKELARDLAMVSLQRRASERVALGEAPADPADERRLTQLVLDSLFGLGRLQALVDDPEIENIDVNGCDCVWVTDARGTKTRREAIADSDDDLIELIRSAAARFGLSERRFDVGHPELDLRLPDGSRLSALMSVVSRPAVSIRRHRFVDVTLADLIDLGGVDREMASFLSAAVRARKNIVVAGAMNSGKTTFIRALCSEIPPQERVVTIEQAFELGLDALPQRRPDLVALEAREANAEGVGQITMARLVRRALRMNADRVIVGEVLGDEILPMLNAMSQGRSGSMCTIHADSSEGAFRRIASYAVQAPERLPIEATNLLIAGAIHFVVFVEIGSAPDTDVGITGRVEDGASIGTSFASAKRARFVSSVREVVDADGLQVVSNEVLRVDERRRTVPIAPLRPATGAAMAEHGYDPGMWRQRGPLP